MLKSTPFVIARNNEVVLKFYDYEVNLNTNKTNRGGRVIYTVNPHTEVSILKILQQKHEHLAPVDL